MRDAAPTDAVPIPRTCAPTVVALSTTAVKGTRMTAREDVVLERGGVPEDRRFHLIDERGRMVNGKHLGALSAVEAEYDHDRRVLTLTFPSGPVVSGTVRLGATLDTRFYSRAVRGRLVDGPWSRALSRHCRCDLRLVEGEPPGSAVDRGSAGAVSLVSRASLARLAEVAAESRVDAQTPFETEPPTTVRPDRRAEPGIDARRRPIDARRFRMLIELAGVGAHAEDEWVDRRVRIGDAVVAFQGHVGRCLVTSRDPDTGDVDLPTLDLLGCYRRETNTTEPLAFGVYGAVLEPGSVRLGDRVTVL